MSNTLKQNKIYQIWPWIDGYNRKLFADDCLAAIIVTILLVPQALAYAVLAGLPPKLGIYASIAPLIAYALFGSSRYVAVGPTAVISLLTAVAIATLPEELRIVSAAALAVMVGVILIGFGLIRGGVIMNFVSRPVVSAYITGSAILIIMSQLKHVFGISADGSSALELARSLAANLGGAKIIALIVGGGTILFLLLTRNLLAYGLIKIGMKAKRAKLIARLAPIIAVVASVLMTKMLTLDRTFGLNIVGEIPQGLPSIAIPQIELEYLQSLITFALVIALVAYVDSMSIAQAFASRTRTRIDANRELIGLGASNLFAGLASAYPINGSFSRSAVNFSAGGKTPIVGVLTAGLMVLTALFFTPALTHLPLATLAAMIIVACFSLIDFRTLWETWVYSKADGITAFLTFLGVIGLGVQWGVIIGVILAMVLHIKKTLKPHMALVGRFPGTEHYRDADRFIVETHDSVKTLRIDESLYYANARYLEDMIVKIVSDSPELTDLILMCPAVNQIDASALDSLEEINKRLRRVNVRLHISELHSHVKERLERTNFIKKLTGNIYLSQQEAMDDLEPEPDWSIFSDHIDIH